MSTRYHCEEIEPQLPDWAAGRLAADGAGRVEAHLQECPRCKAAASSWARFESVLAGHFAGELSAPPAELTARLLAALPAAPRPGSRYRLVAWLLGTAATLTLVLAVLAAADAGPAVRPEGLQRAVELGSTLGFQGVPVASGVLLAATLVELVVSWLLAGLAVAVALATYEMETLFRTRMSSGGP